MRRIILFILLIASLSAYAQIDEYYTSINPANSTFVNDLKARIRSPYKNIAYAQFDETNVANFASYLISGNTRGVRCVYSWYEYTYSGTFAWGTFSREHTWCQSWMPSGASESMNEYSDQHHLFPAHQNGANGVRSNHPLGTVLRVSSTFNEGKYGYNAVSGGYSVYEPRNQHKGDAARALLYMSVRYDRISSQNNFDWTFDNLNNNILPNQSNPEGPQDLATLLQWHRQDPPDKWEVDRNNYIQSIQQNRNPFVDHPEYVNYINFGDLSKSSPSYSAEPSNHITGISQTATNNSITLTWINSTGDILPDGYLVEVYDRNSYYIPIDGYSLTENTSLDSFKVKYIAHSGSTTSYTFSGLTAGKTYYFSIHPYKGSGESINFKTTGEVPRISAQAGTSVLAAEPANQVTNITTSNVTTESITLNWTDALAGSQAPSGYLILAKSSDTFTAPTDGTAYSDDINLSDGSAVINVGTGVQQYSFSSLVSSTTYYFRVYSYNGSGSSINYKTDNFPSLNKATSASEMTLIISEYLEGSSNNKAIELYNASTITIDLSNFKVALYSNGSATATSTHTFPASTLLSPGKVYAIINSQSSQTLINQLTSTNTPYTTSGVTAFNGDDAIAILNSSNQTVDIFGQIGVDPGTAWTGGGVSTLDKTLRRKNTVYTTRSTNGAFDPSVEYTQYNTDDFSGLGSHDFGGTISSTQNLQPRTYTALTVSSGTITLDGNSTIAGNLTLSGGSVIESSDKVLTVKGNITNSGTYSGTGKIVLSGGNARHTISGTGTWGNIEINDASYGAELGSAVNITGTLAFTKGGLLLGDYNLTAETITGGSASSYAVMNGTGTVTVKNIGSTKKTFATGFTDSYNPVSITNTGTVRNFTLALSREFGTGLNNRNLSVPVLFNLTPSGTGSICEAEFQINSGNFSVPYNYFDPSHIVKIGHYSSGSWTAIDANISGSDPYVITATGINSFSPFTAGNEGAFTDSYDLIYSQNFDGAWTGTGKINPPDAQTGTGAWVLTPASGNNSWRSEQDGDEAVWTNSKAGNVKPYGNTGHSANFHTYGTTANEYGDFELLLDLSMPGNKVLSFDYVNTSGTDYIEVYFSSEGSVYESPVVTFGSGPWSKKSISLGAAQSTNCGIRFRAVSDYGTSDIGIDNVEIRVGNVFLNDAAAVSADLNMNISGTTVPKATVKNSGSDTASFSVRMLIDGVQHGSDVNVSNLLPGTARQVSFSSWTVSGTGGHTVTIKTVWAEDENPDNDEIQKTVNAVESNSWSEIDYAQSTYLGSGASSSTHLYSIGGVTTEGASKKCYKIDGTGNVVSVLPDLPSGRTVLASAIAGDYLYAIGGRNSASPYNYLSTVYRYNINSTDAGNNWVQLPQSLPQALGWCKAVTYNNRYIYLAGGFNGTDVLNTVYMYDTETPSAGWVLLSSAMPGTRFGGAFSITGRKLVYIAGASGISTFSNSVFTGDINESDPLSVQWSVKAGTYPGNGKNVVKPAGEDLTEVKFEITKKNNKSADQSGVTESVFPPGSLYGLDAVTWGTDEIAVGGGTYRANFTPEDPSPFYVYNPVTDIWTKKTDIPVPVAGSLIGSLKLPGENLKFISAFGMTYGDRLRSVQVWKDSEAEPVYKMSIVSLPEWKSTLEKEEILTEAYIELRQSQPPYSVAAEKTILQSSLGSGSAEISGIDFSKPYYITVRYINGLEIWSSQPMYFESGILYYDFTADSSKAFGNNMVNINGRWCVISGDINQDGKINAIDRGICWNDRGTADEYSDLNSDGIVNSLDRVLLEKNKNLTVKKPVGAVTSNWKIGKGAKSKIKTND